MAQNNAITRKIKRRTNYDKTLENNRESLKTCSYLLIHHTLMLTAKTQELMVYMDEILHSIFFFGYIFKDKLTPDDFLTPAVYKAVKQRFPMPFQKYNTHLPKRSPFSILLNMMEALYCTEERIKEELLLLLGKLKFPNPLRRPGNKNEQYYTLESTVICCVYSSDSDSQKYFGASLSCRKQNAKEIMIGISCLKTWHDYVAHAVMSFTPERHGNSITFPQAVKCQAYKRDWNRNVYEKRRPCLNCKDLFNLQDADQDKTHHPYGNCAETEGLSKLLRNNHVIQENAVINNHTERNLQNLRANRRTQLTMCLNNAGFDVNNENIQIYEPNANSA